MTTLTIQCIKNNAKDNLSYTMTKTVNCTGLIIACEGLVLQGKDVSDYAVGGTATVCLDEEMGTALAEATADIYAERQDAGDTNPTVAFTLECGKIAPTADKFIISKVTSIEVDEHHEAEQSAESFIALAGAIREVTAVRSGEALEAASVRNLQARNEIAATAVADGGLFQRAKSFLNAPIGSAPKPPVAAAPVVRRK